MTQEAARRWCVSFPFVVVMLGAACDPTAAGSGEEEESGGEVPPRVESSGSSEPGENSSRDLRETQRDASPSSSTDKVALPDPTAAAPSCGIGFFALNTFNCSWTRGLSTIGKQVEASCSSGSQPISGSCWATSSTHKLYRSYMTEGSFDLVNDGQGFSDGFGWACEWDTNATVTNQHIAMALCCQDLPVPLCQ